MLSMLAANPGITHAIASNIEIEPDAVIITVSIRDKATCELTISKDRYDGLAILQMIEEQNRDRTQRRKAL